MKFRRVFHHLLPVIFFMYCFALLSIPVYALSSDDWASWENCFGTPYDYTVVGGYKNEQPTDFPVVADKPYVFCFGAGWSGKAIFTNSPTLICTGSANHQRCSFSVPPGHGYSLIVYSYNIQGTYPNPTGTRWIQTGGSFADVILVSHGVIYGNVIWQQDVTIVDTDGVDISEPIVDENFEFELSVWTDYSIRGYASTNTDNVYRVQFFVCPESSANVDLIADSLFQLLSDLADPLNTPSDIARLKEALHLQYPLVYTALELWSEKVVKAAEASKKLPIAVTIPDSPLAGGLEYAVDLINQVNYITDSSYYGYRGFGGGYIGSSGTDFTINVLNFYSNVRNSPNYTDVNRVYAVFYSNSESEYPVAVLSSTFRVSDFFPTLTFPPLSVPSPSVIDGQPATPNNSGTDWTIFQHAMYMQYLLDQLNRDFSVSLKKYGDSLKLPDYAYTYDSTDLVPYDFDVSVPDVSSPDGLPLDLVRPVSFLGTLWENILDSTGLSVIIPWCMIIGLVAWFFYGKN